MSAANARPCGESARRVPSDLPAAGQNPNGGRTGREEEV
jgi:hypothetical protein